jgi:Mrp family chromosome partitioning ATPase
VSREAHGSRGPLGVPPFDPQVPVFEMLPAFEEEGGTSFRPGPVARIVLDERSEQGEQCRVLGTRIVALGRDKRLRRIGVVGTSAGEGTTTVALGLARALSAHERKRRVLLLELDLDRPSLDDELGLDPPATGLRQYLAGRSEIPVLRRSRPPGFWVLSAGRGSAAREPTPSSSVRLATLLRATDRVFDYVVADCPPVLEGGPAAALRDHLDGLVYVVRSRRTQCETIRRAFALLQPDRVVGVVLNAQRDLLPRGR